MRSYVLFSNGVVVSDSGLLSTFIKFEMCSIPLSGSNSAAGTVSFGNRVTMLSSIFRALRKLGNATWYLCVPEF